MVGHPLTVLHSVFHAFMSTIIHVSYSDTFSMSCKPISQFYTFSILSISLGKLENQFATTGSQNGHSPPF